MFFFVLPLLASIYFCPFNVELNAVYIKQIVSVYFGCLNSDFSAVNRVSFFRRIRNGFYRVPTAHPSRPHRKSRETTRCRGKSTRPKRTWNTALYVSLRKKIHYLERRNARTTRIAADHQDVELAAAHLYPVINHIVLLFIQPCTGDVPAIGKHYAQPADRLTDQTQFGCTLQGTRKTLCSTK